MKNICWLATGGTIASRATKNGLSPGFTAREILELLPQLKTYGNISCKDIMQLDSTNLQPKDWKIIVSYIEKLYCKYDAFIITHGTDTLCWTSAALSCMLENLLKPIIIVGSQLTLEEENTDAVYNLNSAFALAQKGYPGVFAVCGGQIIEGLWAKKLYSKDLRSIQSVNKEPVAVFDKDNIHWNNYTVQMPGKDLKVYRKLKIKIAQVKMMPGLDCEVLYSLANIGYKAIIIESYGAGGIPSIYSSKDKKKDIIHAIEKLTKKGIIIVCTTQCTYDGVYLDRYEVGLKACNAGVISAGKLSSEAAGVKLMVALG